ncbi:MAG: DUF1566 domain-containing protein [Alistipes sp.]|nr:DUF1566 domain-containing protein [Alistipes senegalensis]MCM1250456.1 DUF1566 domain-containing protein [Alistipes sp.]
MKNILSVILIAFCFWSCGDDKSESGNTGNTGSIYGVVTVASTAEPMRATGVELYYHEALLLKTVTYDDGHYEFTDLEAGSYQLRVVATGYDEALFDVIVEAGRTARADMQLTEAYTGMIVRTLDANVVGNKATLNGSYSCDYLRDPFECGFYYATHATPIHGGTRITGTTENKVFNVSINDLEKGTYYVQAYTKNSYGIAYGEERTFQISGAPGVTTLAATNVMENTATLNARIEYAGDPAYTERGFVYSRAFQNPTVDDPADATVKVSVSGTGTEFSANIAGLTKDATYYTRAYATNSNGTVYGESVSFKYVNILDYAVILQESGIMVQKNDISAGADWDTADQLCKASTIGNISNWRLPTIGELEILYENQYSIGGFGEYYYWSSSNRYSYEYYSLAFFNGKRYSNTWSSSYHVRCVRSLD